MKPEHKKEAPSPLKKQTILVSIILIIILGFAVYGNSLNGKFIWDDDILIVNNGYIKDLRNLLGLFTKNITYSTSDESNFYRPLQMLTYTLNYSTGKLNPQIYHLTNIVFHILVAILLYWLTLLVFKNSFLPLVTSLLFVSHPIHTEAVTYISGRADPMVVLFILLTAAFYIKYSDHPHKVYSYFISIISFLFALWCKEIAIVVPLLLVAYDWIYKGIKKMSFKRYLPFLGLEIIYIILRKTILDFPVKRSAIVETTFYQRLPVIFKSVTMYFKKLMLPLDLHMEHELVVPLMTNKQVIAGIAIISILIPAAVIMYRKKEKIVPFSILWFFINYLPISNIYPLNAFFAEHWIYTPSIGLFILAGWIAFKVCQKGRIFKRLVFLLLVFLLIFNSYLTIRQNLYWKDPEPFYKRTLEYNPNSSRVYSMLSLLYFKKGMIDEGIEYAKKALEIKPDFVDALENLANGYLEKGLYDMAIAECEKAIKINPNAINAHLNLGSAYFKKGLNDKAIGEFKKLISINPNHAKAHYNLAVVYYYDSQYALAIKYCDRAIELGYRVDPELLEFLKPYR